VAGVMPSCQRGIEAARNSRVRTNGREFSALARGLIDRRQLLDLLFNRLPLVDHLIDNPELPGIFGSHEVITVERLFNHGVILPGMALVNLIKAPLHLDDVLGMALDIAGLALEAA